MRDYRRWTPREKQALRNMWPTDLTITEIARRLHRHPSVVSDVAASLDLPRKCGRPREPRQKWRIGDPFETTIQFLSGWLTVYGAPPTCGVCGERVYLTQHIQWTGSGMRLKLAHEKCVRRAAS